MNGSVTRFVLSLAAGDWVSWIYLAMSIGVLVMLLAGIALGRSNIRMHEETLEILAKRRAKEIAARRAAIRPARPERRPPSTGDAAPPRPRGDAHRPPARANGKRSKGGPPSKK